MKLKGKVFYNTKNKCHLCNLTICVYSSQLPAISDGGIIHQPQKTTNTNGFNH
jgi:hypothetical protein